MRARSSSTGRTNQPKRARRTTTVAPATAAPVMALRKCRACDWQAEFAERPGLIPRCPWCSAETALVKLIAPAPNATAGAKNEHAAALGRLGGKKGGRARAEKLSPRQRRAIAVKAARARWAANDQPKKTNRTTMKTTPKKKRR